MTIKAYFQYREQDATRYWNLTNANIRLKGILEGTGVVSSVAGQLRVEIAPFTVQTFDGMTVVSDAIETLNVTDDEVYYIVLYAKYQTLGTPTLVLQAITAATYAAHPEKDYLVTFVRLDIPPAAVQVNPADYDGSVRDGLSPLRRAYWKEAVADFASLPTDEQEVQNGDIRLTLDTHTAWVYNSGTTTWDALSVTTTLENVGGRQVEYFADWNRAANGDGIVGGNDRYGTFNTAFTTDPKLSIHEHAGVVDMIGIGQIHAAINGHRVDTIHTDYTMTTAQPAPAAPDRYDLVWLEVWRETTLSPETEVHETYGGGTAAFSVVRDALEDLNINSNEVAGANYDVNQITTTDDNQFVVTKWRVWDMPNVDPLNVNQPHYQVDSGGIKPQNIDGNNFERPLYGVYKGNVWRALSPTAYDDYSWAIPLLVIRRTEFETIVGNNAIKIIRSNGERYVWEVYPTAEVDNGSRITGMSHINTETQKKEDTQQLGASGCLNYPDLQLGVDTLTVPQGSTFHIDGYTHTLQSDLTITLPDAPLLATRHDFVYLEMTRATNPDERVPTETNDLLFTGYDIYRGFVTYNYQLNLAVVDAGVDTIIEDAMATAGFANISPGLYRDISTTDARSPIDYAIWAIPVAIVHRLNQAGWDRAIQPNGGAAGTRPDNRDWHDIDVDDVLDLRHKVVLPGEDLKGLLDESQERLLSGKLRTRMVQHPTWANNYGTGLMEQTSLSVGGTAGTNKLPADPDTLRYIWSDAAEQVVFGETFPANAPYAGTYVTWNGPANPATLTIAAPPGAYIVIGSGDLNPIFGIQRHTASPQNGNGPGISDSDNGDNFTVMFPNIGDLPWTQTSFDANGNAIACSITTNWVSTINPADADAVMHVYYWICYDRSTQLDGQGNIYNDLNQGFQHVPDEVILAENFAGGNDPAIGPLAREMTYVNYTGASLTITAAQITAAYPEFAGPPKIYGVPVVHTEGRSIMHANATNPSSEISISLDDAFTDITITPTVAWVNENIKVLVIFDDVGYEGWFDFRQHTKSLMGPCFWSVQGPWTPGAVESGVLIELAAGQYSLPMDEVIKEGMVAGGIQEDAWGNPGRMNIHGLVYWRAAGSPPGTPWEMTTWAGDPFEPFMRFGALNSHVFTFMFETVPAVPLAYEFMFVIPVTNPAGPAADYIFTTKYTPYQGKNTASSADIDEDLHGVCVASGDPAWTTRGSNDPRIQALDQPTGYIDRTDIVSSDPSRCLTTHQQNDTYCLVQSWRDDYKNERHVAGNASARLPLVDPTNNIFALSSPEFGLDSSLRYEILVIGGFTEREATDFASSGSMPSASPYTLGTIEEPVIGSLLKPGSIIRWPLGMSVITKSALRDAGIVQGQRGWSIAHEYLQSTFLPPGYYFPTCTASYLPGGSGHNWNLLLRELGVSYLEAPEFFSMGTSLTLTITAAALGYHCALISPDQDPGVLRMQVTTAQLPATVSGTTVNAVGNTFDAFLPHRNLILSWNAG